MKKLFDDEVKPELPEVGTLFNSATDQPVDIEILNESIDSVRIAEESIKDKLVTLNTVKGIRDDLLSKPSRSTEYYLSMEAYSGVLKNISANLGHGVHVPSLEDLRDNFVGDSARDIAMEGIRDIIRRVWESIKKFFTTFFNKLSEFSRRLIKANLQVDTYEKYVPDLIKKIKANKLTTPDNRAKVSSKLIELLAPPELDRVDSVWMVNNGNRIVENAIDLCEHLTKVGIPAMVTDMLPTLNSTLTGVLNNLESSIEHGNAEEACSAAKQAIAEVFQKSILTMCRCSVDVKDLSESAYESLINNVTDSTVNDLQLQAVVDNSNTYKRVPMNFNMVIGVDQETSKIYSVTSASDNTSHPNDLEILGDLRALEAMYDTYKNLTKKFDTRRFSDSIDKAENALNGALKAVPKTISDFGERYEKTSNGAKKINISAVRDMNIDTPLGMTTMAVNLILNNPMLDDDIKDNVRPYSKDLTALSDVFHRGDETDADIKEALQIFDSVFSFFASIVSLARNKGHKIFADAIDVAEAALPKMHAILSAAGMIDRDTPMVSEETRKLVSKTTSEIEKLIVNYIQITQVVLRGTHTEFVKIITELRYELIKYIYDSARTFG